MHESPTPPTVVSLHSKKQLLRVVIESQMATTVDDKSNVKNRYGT